MKSSISVSILFVLLISVGKINAQYVSPYNSSGNLRSSYDRAAEESRNRAIKPYKSEAVPVPTRKTYTPTQTPEPKRQTAEEKAAQILIWERQAKLDLGAAAAKKTNEEAREAELAAKKAAFKKKVAKYDFVDWQTTNKSEVLVKLKGKYGFVNELGFEIVPIIYDTVSSFSNGVSFVKLGNKYGTVDKTGVAIIPLIYENIKSPSRYYFYGAKFNGLWGFIDEKGTTKITFEYDSVLTNHERSLPAPTYYLPIWTATVVKAGLRFSIDTAGAVVGKKTDINTGKIVSEKKQTGSFTDDRDNKTYGTIKIGTQVWMSENLDVTHLNNGEKIEQAKSKRQWRIAGENKKPAWCYYDNDAENGKKYGKLYNYYALEGLAPKGWHIPEKEEWDKLTRYLGAGEVGGDKLRSAASWGREPSAQDECGFDGLPGGERDYQNEFKSMSSFGSWWGLRDPKFIFKHAFQLGTREIEDGYNLPQNGLSVRCIKDDEEATSPTDLNKKKN